MQWPEQHAVCPPTGKINIVFLLTAHLQCQKIAFNFKCKKAVRKVLVLLPGVFDHTVNRYHQISSLRVICKGEIQRPPNHLE